MTKTAIAAPAQEPPTDTCNWLPLKALSHPDRVADEMCGRPCVREITVAVGGQPVTLHLCAKHNRSEVA